MSYELMWTTRGKGVTRVVSPCYATATFFAVFLATFFAV
jgi:hypothetical protein